MTKRTGEQPDNQGRHCDGPLDTSGAKTLAGKLDGYFCPRSNIDYRSMQASGLEILRAGNYPDT